MKDRYLLVQVHRCMCYQLYSSIVYYISTARRTLILKGLYVLFQKTKQKKPQHKFIKVDMILINLKAILRTLEV